MAEHVIEPGLFELLDEYVGELDAGEAIVDDVVPQASKVVLFTEAAFAQFFENEIGVEIKGFDEYRKQDAARAVAAKEDELSVPARRLVVLFNQFCDRYDDVKSATYGSQETVLAEFHKLLLVRLVQRIVGLAKTKGDAELKAAAGGSLQYLKDIVEGYDWSEHHRRGDQDE